MGQVLSKGDSVLQAQTPPTQARQTASPHPPPGLHAQPCFSLFPSDRLADSYFPKVLVTSPSLVVVAGLKFFFFFLTSFYSFQLI